MPASQMSLLLFLSPVGYQTSAWRHPHSRSEELYGLDLPADIARRAEAAKLHALFLADWLSFEETGRNPDLNGYEPFTTIAALSAVTKHIGLIGTAATSFWPPYLLARQLAQIDWLSKGRAGWNIVTATTGQENFNCDLPPRNERYARAYDYMAAMTGLWDGWQDDAVLNDRAGGVWADNARIRATNHQSAHLKIEGPLMLPRSPQGWPVLAQAGASEAGRDFAAHYGEVVFTVTPRLGIAQEFYGDLKSRVEKAGRPRSALRVHPGLMPIVGDDAKDAARIQNELLDYTDEQTGLARLRHGLEGADLSGLDWNDTIPPERLKDPALAVMCQEATTRYPYYHHLAVEQKYTLRQMMREVMRAAGHAVIPGSAEEIADHMQHWFENGAADGFALLPPTCGEALDRILTEVVPILQERGLFRRDYAEGTLRDNLGLPRPPAR